MILRLPILVPSPEYEYIANATKSDATLLFVVQVPSIQPTNIEVAISLETFYRNLKQAALGGT